jgi:hypothetical protein
VSGPVFVFCTPEVIFEGTEGVGSHFHVLRSRTHFRRYRGRWVLFSCFARLDSFSAVASTSGSFFMFCAHKFVFGGTEGVGSRLHVFAPGLVFGGTGGVGSCFHVLRARTHFQQYRRRQVQFSCFVLPDSFSAVPMALGSVFFFCTPELAFDGTEGVGSCFHVLRAWTHFQRYIRRWVQFSCFALPDSFSAVPRASSPVFTFCSPGLVFDCTDDVGSRFHFLLA